jgi:hypothetical protein
MNEYEPISGEETDTLLSLAKNTEPIFMHA